PVSVPCPATTARSTMDDHRVRRPIPAERGDRRGICQVRHEGRNAGCFDGLRGGLTPANAAHFHAAGTCLKGERLTQITAAGDEKGWMRTHVLAPAGFRAELSGIPALHATDAQSSPPCVPRTRPCA